MSQCPFCFKWFVHLNRHTSQSCRCRIGASFHFDEQSRDVLSTPASMLLCYPSSTVNRVESETQLLRQSLDNDMKNDFMIDIGDVNFTTVDNNKEDGMTSQDGGFIDNLSDIDSINSATEIVGKNKASLHDGQPNEIHISAFGSVVPQCVVCAGTLADDGTANFMEATGEVITAACSSFATGVLTDYELLCLRIMSMCDEVGCPRYFYDKLVKVLFYESVYNGFSLSRKLPQRSTLLTRLNCVCSAPPPIADVLSLENWSMKTNKDFLNYKRLPRDEVILYRYEFLPQLLDLISDQSIFGNLEMLDVNKRNGLDRFGRFERFKNCIYEVNSGNWYQEAYTKMITDSRKEVLLPLICYVDKTGTDIMQRHGLEPFMFSTSVINLSQRQNTRLWRVLCYIPELQGKSSAQSKSEYVRLHGKHQRDYHNVLERALQSLVTAQNNVVCCWLRLGDEVKRVQIHFPVAFVINDGKSADMLCTRKGSYNRKCGRISRACNAPAESCSRYLYKCKYLLQGDIDEKQELALGRCVEESDLLQKEIMNLLEAQRHTFLKKRHDQQLAAQKWLNEMSTHAVRNAFRNVNFGGDVRGIYGATPVDLMHAFNEGVLKYCMEAIFDLIPPKMKANLDNIVDVVFCRQRSSVRHLFPQTNFVKGFTNLTLITATERIGVCFTVFILSMLEQGKQIFLKLLNGHGNNEIDLNIDSEISDVNEDNSVGSKGGLESDDVDGAGQNLTSNYQSKLSGCKRLPCNLVSLQELLQALLCFHAWAKCSPSFDCTKAGVERMKYAIQVMLQKIKKYLPRGTGMGWNLQKFHGLSHLPDDIIRFGSPQNTDAGSGERSLKYFAKAVLSTAMKREDKFLCQVASRLHEQCSIFCAKRLTDPLHEWETPTAVVTTSFGDIVRGQLEQPRLEVAVDIVISRKNPSYLVMFDSNGNYMYSRRGCINNKQQHTTALTNTTMIHPLVEQWFIDNQKKTINTITDQFIAGQNANTRVTTFVPIQIIEMRDHGMIG